MPSVIGSAAVNFGSTHNPAAVTVTVPSGTVWAYLFYNVYSGSNGITMSAQTLGGNNANATQFSVTGSNVGSGRPGVGARAWLNPTAGAQNLDVAWNVAPGDGPAAFMVYVDDADTAAPWRDADGNATGDATAISVTIDTSTTDLVIKWDSRFDATPPSLTAGWTSVGTQTNENNYSSRVSRITPAGATQVVAAEDESFSGCVGISIQDAGGAATIYTRRPLDSPIFTSRILS
jgi:hypothetical protein